MPDTEQAPTRHRPATADVVGTLVLAGVGVYATVAGLGYGFTGDDGRVGPGFLPVVTGAFIAGASLLELARMFLARSPAASSYMASVEHVEEDARAAIQQAHPDDERPAPGGRNAAGEELDTFGRTHSQRNWAVLQIFGILLVAILLIPVLGLLLSMSLMTFTIFVAVEGKRWLTALLATAGAFAFFYVFFAQILGIPLPTGMLGIV
ncbi:tripartite tricarboxylate transporter TctB family protein [Ornithinicoccus halotolerans]|uniref:tripartite tricarboxylate transporter TctB family protein n=1 Tax=Ornithinicoccus halotolerans TaxID=1748220 RepID=UPI0012950BF5|nr:tripartite tricarboxylate transporter TctB family protein [Ornithinicoccus halotolerans]